jgi:signal transduction histidine kinase
VLSLVLCFGLCAAYAGANVFLHRRATLQLGSLESLETIYYKTLDIRPQQGVVLLDTSTAAIALNKALEAERLMSANPDARLRAQGFHDWSKLKKELRAYTENLRRTNEYFTQGHQVAPLDVSSDLRDAAARLEATAATLIAQEREVVRRTLTVSAALPWFLLIVLLVLFTVIAYLFNRALVFSISRFQRYTRRIGQGDHTLIKPARKYRDEFTELALTVNEMLTEFQVNQERLLRAGKLTAVGTLTSGIAHELNNPLNNIYITVQALADQFKTLSDDEKWKLLQDVYFETERASEIVKSLLDFTRQEQPEMAPLDIGEVIEATRGLVQHEMDLHDVSFSAKVPPGVPLIRGALNPLKQVFLNLFLNATQAMPNGGTITVRVFSHMPGRLCADVADNGPGIQPEVLPHIFEPFFTTKETGMGTGLGLSVTYSIVRKHGGDIQAESRLGEGTVFHLCLPTIEG